MSKHYFHGRPTIGVLIGWHVYWTPTPYSYLTPIFRGISAAIKQLDCNLLLACGMGSQTNQSDPTRPAWPTLAKDVDFVPVGPWNTDGIIVINPLMSDSRSADIHALRDAGHPVIYIGNGEGEPAIGADNEGGIFQGISHLIEHGHRHIAFIAGNQEDVDGDSGRRLDAFHAGLAQFGLPIDEKLIEYGYHTFEGGAEAARRLLSSGSPFTAIMSSNDESAMGAMTAIKKAGLRIPQDIAIIGFDDRPESVAQDPPLTSVHVPLYRSGYQAVAALLQQIYDNNDTAQSLKIPTQLAIRQSCGCSQDTLIPSAIPDQAAIMADPDLQLLHVLQAMTNVVLAETQRFNADEVQIMCENLLSTFVSSIRKDDPSGFQSMVQELLERSDAEEDDAHIWQAAISRLRSDLPAIIMAAWRPDAYLVAMAMVDHARNTISERMRRQHGRHTFDQKWLTNRIGSLTARLLMTSDESQILDVLSKDLPAMGIRHASLSFFEADGDDPVAWSRLHAIPTKRTPPLRFPTREFPPTALYGVNEPFALAVLPLSSPTGRPGFVTYDSLNIELDGPITQQITAALNNVRLYMEATEGRKLAEEANSLKSRFLSMVSHELRTPLNLVVGLSEMLLQKREQGEQPLPTPYRKDIEQIYFSAQHLGRLIRDVLDLASSQVGQLRLANEMLELGETLEMVAATGRRLTSEKGLGWQDSLPTVKLWVWGDRTRLRQVALNLVSNAVKFTASGEVRLQVEVRDGKAYIIVSDTGPGVAVQEQELIFDEFRRSEKAQGYGGLGLGLAISRRLVEMHGGEIGVESAGQPGAGATFYFSLPLIETDAIQGESLLPLSSEGIILLLTNQSGSSERLREHLLQKGHEVKTVQIEQDDDWLPGLLKTQIGAIVLDMAIAPTQGWNILRMLKDNASTRGIPVLFYSLTKDKGAMLDLDYLTKPIKTADLARAVEHHTDESKREKLFLIVDDDPATLEMHVRMVQSQRGKPRVLRARNGREALEIMQKQRPDLVLLDLMMPELDGFGVLEAMREKDSTRDIPVIVLTGQILTEKEMERLNRGVATVLGKGLFSVEETLSHIDAALVHKRRLGTAAQRLVRRAMAYVHEHYTEPLTRDDLAQHLSMNSDYLTHCFRTEVGMTPITYLNRYRVNKARVLLAESDMNVTEIAMAVGFSDSSYFGRVFRRQVGVSPDAYRRN